MTNMIKEYILKVYRNNLLIDLIYFNTRQEMDKYIEENNLLFKVYLMKKNVKYYSYDYNL
jgi:hypothetical protein